MRIYSPEMHVSFSHPSLKCLCLSPTFFYLFNLILDIPSKSMTCQATKHVKQPQVLGYFGLLDNSMWCQVRRCQSPAYSLVWDTHGYPDGLHRDDQYDQLNSAQTGRSWTQQFISNRQPSTCGVPLFMNNPSTQWMWWQPLPWAKWIMQRFSQVSQMLQARVASSRAYEICIFLVGLLADFLELPKFLTSIFTWTIDCDYPKQTHSSKFCFAETQVGTLG